MALGEAKVIITASLKMLRQRLREAKSLITKSLRSVSGGLARGLTRSMGRLFTSLIRNLKRLAVVAVASFAAAVKSAATFQTQMQMVNTMLSKQTEPLLKGFADGIRNMSVEFGQGTDVLAKGLFDILSASIPASKALDVLAVSSRAAVAGMTDTAIAADVLTTLINAFGLEAEDAGAIADKLFATVKKGKTTFPELASALGRVASTANLAGMSMDEMLATLATMTRAGINTNEATTSLNGVLRSFLAPTREATEAAREFGLELSSQSLKTIGFLGSVEKLNKASVEQLAAIVPNIRAFKAMAVAVNDLKGVQADLAFISTQAAGKTEEAFSKRAATLAFAGTQLKQSIVDTARLVGGESLDRMKTFFDEMKTKLGENKKSFKSLGKIIQENLLDPLLTEVEDFAIIAEGFGLKEALAGELERLKGLLVEILPDVKEKAAEVGRVIGAAIVDGVTEKLFGEDTIFGLVGRDFAGMQERRKQVTKLRQFELTGEPQTRTKREEYFRVLQQIEQNTRDPITE